MVMSGKLWRESLIVSTAPSPNAVPGSATSTDDKGHKDIRNDSAPCHMLSHHSDVRWCYQHFQARKLGQQNQARRDLMEEAWLCKPGATEIHESYTHTLLKMISDLLPRKFFSFSFALPLKKLLVMTSEYAVWVGKSGRRNVSARFFSIDLSL